MILQRYIIIITNSQFASKNYKNKLIIISIFLDRNLTFNIKSTTKINYIFDSRKQNALFADPVKKMYFYIYLLVL